MSISSGLFPALALLALGAGQVTAQARRENAPPDSARAAPIVYSAWHFDVPPALPDSRSLKERLRLDPAPQSGGKSHWLLGGIIGTATGLVTCTVISNLVNSDVEGTTTCDTKAYFAFGAGGFVVGALVGSLIK